MYVLFMFPILPAIIVIFVTWFAFEIKPQKPTNKKKSRCRNYEV